MDNRRKFLAQLGAAVAATPAIAGVAQLTGGTASTQAHASSSVVSTPPPTQARGGDNYPPVLLTSQTGKHYRFYEDLVHGKLVAIHFTSLEREKHFPALARMKRIADRLGPKLGREYQFYTITTDPKNDTPKALRAYAEKNGLARPGWLFLNAGGVKAVSDLSDRLLHPMPGMNHGGPNSALLYYGNGSVGLWGAFPLMQDNDDLAIQRLSWIRSRSAPVALPRRAGPRILGNDFTSPNRIV